MAEFNNSDTTQYSFYYPACIMKRKQVSKNYMSLNTNCFLGIKKNLHNLIFIQMNLLLLCE